MAPITEPTASWILLLARICLAGVFIVSGVHKAIWYRQAVAEFAAARVPWVGITLPLTIALHLVAPLCLIAGRFTTTAALALAAFTALATVWVHDFWNMSGPDRLARSRIFMAHMAVAGGLLLLAVTGPGRLS